MNTKQIVESYFEFVNSGRWDDYLNLFADNIIMDEQLLGHIEGKEALTKGIEGLRGNPDFRNYPKEIVVDGDKAMVCWNIQSPLPDGSKLDLKGANFYRIKDGKIAYFANFHDTAPFANL
jgi:ketosteroid isomerase-like protein